MSPDEERTIQTVNVRLRGQFPTQSVENVELAVMVAYDSFKGARIRDFIPVLVEKEARDKLAHLV